MNEQTRHIIVDLIQSIADDVHNLPDCPSKAEIYGVIQNLFEAQRLLADVNDNAKG